MVEEEGMMEMYLEEEEEGVWKCIIREGKEGGMSE